MISQSSSLLSLSTPWMYSMSESSKVAPLAQSLFADKRFNIPFSTESSSGKTNQYYMSFKSSQNFILDLSNHQRKQFVVTERFQNGCLEATTSTVLENRLDAQRKVRLLTHDRRIEYFVCHFFLVYDTVIQELF